MEELSTNLGEVEKKMMTVAEYFCEDHNKFKLEELFSELLSFIQQFEEAAKVGGGGHVTYEHFQWRLCHQVPH